MGPFFIENNLNGNKYLDMLQNHIGQQYDEYFNQDNVFCYQQDVYPANH